MRRHVTLLLPVLLAIGLIVAACTTPYDSNRIRRWEARYNDSALGPVTPDQLLAEARVKLDLIPAGTVGRR